MATIDQNGNAFGTDMNIGTNDNFVVNVTVNSATIGTFDSSGLHVDIGTVTGSKVLGSFSQNDGLLQIANSTSVANNFNPCIYGTCKNVNDVGLGFVAQGSNTYLWAGFEFSTRNTNGMGGVTSGNTFRISNFTTPQLTVDHSGSVTIDNLAGTGTRMVTADGAGTLEATTEVSSGSYTPIITGNESYTPNGFRYIRVGEIVHVSGVVEVGSSSTGNLEFNISLPPSIPSTFTNEFDLTGVVSGVYITQDYNLVGADNVNNEATVKFTAATTTTFVYVQFDYIVQ